MILYWNSVQSSRDRVGCRSGVKSGLKPEQRLGGDTGTAVKSGRVELELVTPERCPAEGGVKRQAERGKQHQSEGGPKHPCSVAGFGTGR
ncbi:hypothetical protein DdX_21431 [Ditylenchus destructor]|uniref:Uncharacterized protein n=1 Tax=Ditylenchus destructor TaxID=166010 RepID=A0AAD4MGH5_9BILA|nr:hypothetical protein DdX_21431 [Ditylenchus destructor]